MTLNPHPLRVLESPDEQLDEPGDGARVPQRKVVGGAQSQVPNEADHRLDQRPPRRGMQQVHDDGDAALEADSVLGHFRLRVARSQVTQCTHLKRTNSYTIPFRKFVPEQFLT